MRAVKSKPIEQRYDELHTINQEIAERRQYLEQQERQINDLIERGNTKLMELNHDIIIAEHVLKDLKTSIRVGKQDKQVMEQDLEAMRVQFAHFENNGMTLDMVRLSREW